MKILLFNDNPVVQKLVALSAQKTKDDLTVASSPAQIEGESCDLLIIDDALYSDETFEMIKEQAAFKNSLLMATRGNAVPAGFDNVINKPFLPTDLVDTLIQIEKRIIAAASHEAPAAFAPENESKDAEAYAIDLEETLSEFEPGSEGDFAEDTAEESEMGLDLETLDVFEEGIPTTAILDHEEVQEVRGLLEDTENDALEEDFDTMSGFEEETAAHVGEESDFTGIGEEEESIGGAPEEEEEELDIDALMAETGVETPEEAAKEEEELDIDALMAEADVETPEEAAIEEDDLDIDALMAETDVEALDETVDEEEPDELASKAEEAHETESEEETFDFDEGMFAEEEHTPQHPSDVSDPYDFDMLGGEEFSIEEAALKNQNGFVEEEEDFDDLELKIQEAMENLEPEDLDRELEETMFTALETGETEEEDTIFDELDLLDERELKLAIGEEVESEPEVYVGESSRASMAAEALGEVMGRPLQSHQPEEKTPELVGTPAEGAEALQTLLKALANEEVAKSLKGLNITININFGNNA